MTKAVRSFFQVGRTELLLFWVHKSIKAFLALPLPVLFGYNFQKESKLFMESNLLVRFKTTLLFFLSKDNVLLFIVLLLLCLISSVGFP